MAKTSAERQAASMARLRARAAERDTLATQLEQAHAKITQLEQALADARQAAQPFDPNDLERITRRAVADAIESQRYG